MEERKKTIIIFKEIQDAIHELTNSDLDKIITGEYSFTLKLVKKKQSISNDELKTPPLEFKELLYKILECSSREEGNDILINTLKTKTDYEKFARFIEVAVMKSDKVDKIKDNIIESTIGAKLRSDAIQNKS